MEEENKEYTGTENMNGVPEETGNADALQHIIPLAGMYENWFLDYASYVILERAVPALEDGLKPVQRRLLHAMKELDDGRYNKVANIVGHTMKYHPHGDASIGDALVQLGQKDLLIDCQGNWGNILTGDSAAASRYIEARLSKFALEVAFNPKTTTWKLSYDGRNKEPVTLPVKFPLLLAQGVEGIAVGLASKILPHNFNELIDASINVLEEKIFEIYPDFPTGGLIDVSKYNDGLRGGKIRVRAKINQIDKKTLSITEIPFGTTTISLIDSIISANDKGKIKIRKIDDNTAAQVEIMIYLQPGVSPDTTIDALYAFTDCEVSISPNACVVLNSKPLFFDVKEMLRFSVRHTLKMLKSELEIERAELMEQLLFASLEKIFIEKRIYREIEECPTWELVIETIDKGLDPYKKQLYREITTDDIIRLTEIKIKRISKFNSFKADEIIAQLEERKQNAEFHLAHLVEYAIAYYQNIRKKYGKGRERRTEIRNFDVIEATMVAAANQKLYVNRKEGFMGTGLKKDEFVCDCSDIDDVIVFRENGLCTVNKVSEKSFVGENIIHIDIFRKNDDRTIYNMVYQDGKYGKVFVKRFAVMGITRDKEYDLTQSKDGSRVLYFSANPNGEAEIVKITLKAKAKLKKQVFEFDFSTLAIKNRNSMGNTLTKHAVRKIEKKEDGISTLGARDIWYDDSIKRLNTESRGSYLGAFMGDDRILTLMRSGHYRLYNFDISNHFDDDLLIIEKYDPEKIITVVYYNASKQDYFVKRFIAELSDKKNSVLGDNEGDNLIFISTDYLPQIEVVFDQNQLKKPRENEIISLADFTDAKSYKVIGKRLANAAVKEIIVLEPLPYELLETEEGEGAEKDEIPGWDFDNENAESKSDIADIKAKLPESDIKLPEPDIKLAEPDIKLAESDIKLAEPDIKLAEFDIKLAESDIKLAEPGVKTGLRKKKDGVKDEIKAENKVKIEDAVPQTPDSELPAIELEITNPEKVEDKDKPSKKPHGDDQLQIEF
jgi:topoisomerase-4 subunit A